MPKQGPYRNTAEHAKPQHFATDLTTLNLLGPGQPHRVIAMLLTQGDIVMRILSKRDLKELVLYSPQHIARLEKKAGGFPKRIQLGSNRVGWVESEVLDWLNERISLRNDQPSS